MAEGAHGRLGGDVELRGPAPTVLLALTVRRDCTLAALPDSPLRSLRELLVSLRRLVAGVLCRVTVLETNAVIRLCPSARISVILAFFHCVSWDRILYIGRFFTSTHPGILRPRLFTALPKSRCNRIHLALMASFSIWSLAPWRLSAIVSHS